MASEIDTHNLEDVSGSIYFIVGKGTEGGPDSYGLSVAGITGNPKPGHQWGDTQGVAADSGYGIGTIQVDLGKRGDWPLGATRDSAPEPGNKSYIDAIVDQSSAYALKNGLKFTSDTDALRNDLHTHGKNLKFIDRDTIGSINKWAGSDDGKKWIHANIDYPQAKNISERAIFMVDQYGKNISEDRRLETISIIAKTENQLPGLNRALEKTLKDGGSYDDVLRKAETIKEAYHYYDGPKAAAIAEKYAAAAKDPVVGARLIRASAKVASGNHTPSIEENDADIETALAVIGGASRTRHIERSDVLKMGARGDAVRHAQEELHDLGYLQAEPNGRFGPQTKAATMAFQRDEGIEPDGKIGRTTQGRLESAVQTRNAAARDQQISDFTAGLPPLRDFSDPSHPQNALYNTLKEGFPPGVSPQVLSQCTAACYIAGIRQPDDLGHVTGMNGSILFESNSLFGNNAMVDMSEPTPSVQQTMQSVQQFDQQRAINSAQFQAQQTQINAQAPQGPGSF